VTEIRTGLGSGVDRTVRERYAAKRAKLLPKGMPEPETEGPDGTAPADPDGQEDAAGRPARRGIRSLEGVGLRVASVVALFLVWYIASLFLSKTVLPGPASVVSAMWSNLHHGDTYTNIWATIYRVFIGVLAAIIAGLVIGLLMGLSRRAEQFLDSIVMVGLTIPAVVYGIVGILWFGLNSTSAIVAIAMTTAPAVALNIWQGVKSIDVSVVHMGQAFRFSRLQILRHAIAPQVVPFLLASVRYALGIGWKTATIVELIGLNTGVGYQLSYWFGLYNMQQVLAWTLTFTLVLLIIEFLLIKPLEAYVTRWRPRARG
jgi:NitT/TauT family transport system permease protein